MENKKLKAISYRLLANRGFTLIELLVVIVLISILMLSSINLFISYSKSQTLNTAVADVVSLLNVAKSRAVSQVKPSDCTGQKLMYYQVYIVPSNSNYILKAACDTSVYSLQTKTLPSNILFTDSSPVLVDFMAATGILNQQKTITISGAGSTKTITIDTIGNISVQ